MMCETQRILILKNDIRILKANSCEKPGLEDSSKNRRFFKIMTPFIQKQGIVNQLKL